MSENKISKREFLKYSLYGLGGTALGFSYLGCLGKAGNSKEAALDTITTETPEVAEIEELWKWSKEAMFSTVTPRGAKCGICPNNCTLKLNEVSICRNRVNYKNKLYSIGYGNPCSANIDPVEKKPLFHFLPQSRAYSIAVAGCNFVCLNCQNWTISQSSPKETRNYDLFPAKVVENAQKTSCKSIAFTYSEPVTFYEYMYDTARLAKAEGIKNLMISNGYINEKPLRELCKYIDAANIDLKSFKNDIYLKLNAGTLKPVLDTLKTLKEENVWVEITNLIIPTWNDDFDMIKEMCKWLVDNGLDVFPIHFSRFYPTYKLTKLPSTPASTLKKAHDIALEAGMKYVYIGNMPGSNAENTNCPNCGKTVIQRKGYRVLTNNLQNGKCKFCSTKIHGVWS